MFTRNTALGFGGAFAVENYRAGNDTTLVLNHLCFIQYNIGGEHEYEPGNWEVRVHMMAIILTVKAADSES